MRDNNIHVDERCRPGHSTAPTQGGWADAVADGCTAIPPKDEGATSRYTAEESKPAQEPEPESESGTEPNPGYRQDPIPSDLLEMGAYYNKYGFLIIPTPGTPIVPEEVDDFF